LWQRDGLPQRFNADVLRLADTSRRFHRDAVRCSQLPLAGIAAGNLCELHAPAGDAPVAVIWGDSHALALLPAFESLAVSRNWRLEVGTHSSCPPLSGISTPRDVLRFGTDCEEFNQAMMLALQRLQPRLVVLAAYWVNPAGGFTITGHPELVSTESRFDYALEQTVRQIAAPGRSICIVRGIPRLEYPVPVALARARLRGIDAESLRISSEAARAQYAAMEPALLRLMAERRVIVVDPKDRLCDGARCRLANDAGQTIYSDSNHLNIDGALFVTDSLARCFDAPR
jgi:hypothetical protein